MKKTGFLALVSSVTVAAGTVGIGLPQITNAETTTKLTNVDTVLIYNPLMYESGVTKSTGNIVGQGTDAYETINGLYVPADNDENAGSAQNAASSGIEYFDHSKDEFQDLTEYYNSKAKESNKSNSSNEVISKKNVLPAVGSTKDFHILQDMNNESAYDNAVQFKCMAVGSKGIVWTYDSPNITTEFAQEILKEFDDNIYASDNKHFGNARFDDPENNQLVNILVYPMTQSNLGGFAYSKDCYSTDEANYYSNLDPSKMNTDQCIMHTNYNVWTRSGGKQTVYGVIAHEFQHLISYAYILGNKNAMRFIPAYLTEGTAMEAEELYKSGLVRNQGYINEFNESDQIIKGKSIYNFRSNVSSYGASYLYTDYITRLSDPTASDVTMWKTFLTNWREAKTKTDLNIGNILKKTLPADKVSQIDSVIEYPDSIKQDINTSADNSDICKNEDEWLSKLTLAHYISLVLKEEQGSIYGIASNISADVGPYTCPANASNTSANIEGGGRIYVRTADSSTFTIPEDADPGLIYVGFKDHKMTVAPTTADEYDKTYTVNYEWTNAPVTEEIPESGKTYNGYTNASKNKDTKYTSSYETVVDDKVYRFSGWTENVNDTTITYTGTWTATDIIDFSKAGIQVYPASTTYTGYPIVPIITVSYNGNVVDSSEYTVTFLDYKGETVSSDKLIHAGDYTIVISPKAGEKYNRGIGRAYYVINKKTSTRAPRFASYEKGSFSPDNNGSFTYNAPVKPGCEYKLDNGTWQDSNTFYNVKKGSSHTLYVRYKGTSDVTESASTTIAITAPSDASLIKLENDGFRIINNLNAGDYYNIETVARKDGFVDISGASQQNNANVDLWSNNGNPCQKFYFEPQGNGTYQIKTDVTDGTSVLEADSGKVSNGTNIKQYSDRDQNGTYFLVMKNDKNQYVFVVANKNGSPALTSDGKVQLMDLTGARTGNGTNIWTWEYISGSETQMWNLIKTASNNEVKSKGFTLVKDFAEGEYNILSASNSNYALDVSGGSVNNGANIGLWERNFANAQKFRIEKANENGEYYIRTASSGYNSSVDVSGASPNRGANVDQWTSYNNYAQTWKIYRNAEGSYIFINSVSGKALDISGGNVRNGQNVDVWDLNALKNAQCWKIESATTFDAAHPELEKITNIGKLGISENDWIELGSAADSSFRLDISGGKDANANGQNANLWKANGANAQKYRIKKLSNGNFIIQTRASNGTKVIDISGGNKNASTNISQWNNYSGPAQQWQIYRVKGTNNLVFKHASGYCVMDVCGASMNNGANVWLWFYSKGNAAQQWRIVR